MIRFPLAALLCFALAAGAGEAVAGDHDQARQLRHQGEIMPLAQILRQISPRYPGRVLEVELKQQGGRPIYKIEQLGRDGVVREITVDAKHGTVLEVESE